MTELPIIFDIHDSLSGVYVGTLDFDSWAFNEPVVGVGSFEASLPIKNATQGRLIRSITQPHKYSIYARHEDTYLWGGPITGRPWSRSAGMVTIQAMRWEGWLYNRLLQTKFIRVGYDQFTIVRALVGQAIRDFGCPEITMPGTKVSIIRDLTVDPWNSYGEAIDRLAARDPGFDWSIQIRKHKTTGNPELYLALWFPERKSILDPQVLFESIGDDETPEGGNSELDEWPDDSAEQISRMWATGDGSPPDQPSANDEDPAMSLDTVLLIEAVTNWTGVVKRTTLQEHAARERKARGAPIQTVAINVNASNPDVRTYMPGDRVRFIARDRWVDEDFPGVRIMDRAIRGSRTEGSSVSVVLDLNDFEAPDEGEGVDA